MTECINSDSKPTNPKDNQAISRLPTHLVPDTLVVYAATAFAEGDLKYGQFNWRVAGVRASVYISAMERHLKDWKNGQDRDPVTKVHNLASAIACLGIILDAELCKKLTDDRPPSAPVAELIDAQEEVIKHLQSLYGDRNPRRYTIHDSESVDARA